VSLVLVAAGSVDDFGLARRTELRTRVATAAGVAVEMVTLSVEAASVRLHFSVRVEATVSSVLTTLEAALPSADAASVLLGVTVLAPPLLTLDAPPSTPPSPLDLPPRPHRDPISTSPPLEERASHVESGDGDSGLPLLLAGAGALMLAGLLVALAAALLRRAKRCAIASRLIRPTRPPSRYPSCPCPPLPCPHLPCPYHFACHLRWVRECGHARGCALPAVTCARACTCILRLPCPLPHLTTPHDASSARWPRSFDASSEMMATAVDLSNLPPLVTPPGTVIAVHQSAVLGHRLTQPSTSELAQVISYEAYAPPPQPQPAPAEKTAPALGASSSQAGAAAGASPGYMADYI
jgi:hypothetical protein